MAPTPTPTSTSTAAMQAVKAQLTETVPVLGEILKHMQYQNSQMAILLTEQRISNQRTRQLSSAVVVAVILLVVVVVAMFYQTMQQQHVSITLAQTEESLAQAKLASEGLKKDLDTTADKVSSLLEKLSETQREVKQTADDVPKLMVDGRGKLKMEVAVDPEVVSKRPLGIGKKASIQIDSGRITYE